MLLLSPFLAMVSGIEDHLASFYLVAAALAARTRIARTSACPLLCRGQGASWSSLTVVWDFVERYTLRASLGSSGLATLSKSMAGVASDPDGALTIDGADH